MTAFKTRTRLPSTCFLSLVFLLCGCGHKASTPAAIFPVPNARQLAWHKMETNAFVHFTVNTFTDREWGTGGEDPGVFNPTNLDVAQWARVFKEAGFKGVILTCKHHDGFCLWPSQYTDHDISASPYKDGKGDVVGELAAACRAEGLKFGVYVSPWDRNNADYGRPAYIAYYRNQLRELFNNYGPLFEMWFDGANGGDGYYGGTNETRRIDGSTYYDWPTTLDMVRSLEPNIIFFSDAGPGVRWCGNERGVAGETNWDMITPDTLYAGKPGINGLLNQGSAEGSQWMPAEIDVSIRPGWFYHKSEDSLVKSPEKLFEIYLSSVGRGSTLLLNVPPDRKGRIHPHDVETLLAWRALIDRTFENDLAQGATASASTFRGEDETYGPEMAIDGDPETYWATDDGQTAASLEIQLLNPSTIRYVTLREYITLGQRISAFDVEARENGNWRVVASGTTVGNSRILSLGGVKADRVRVTVKSARACPLLSSVELY